MRMEAYLISKSPAPIDQSIYLWRLGESKPASSFVNSSRVFDRYTCQKIGELSDFYCWHYSSNCDNPSVTDDGLKLTLRDEIALRAPAITAEFLSDYYRKYGGNWETEAKARIAWGYHFADLFIRQMRERE